MSEKLINGNFKKEYKRFIEKYLCQLLGFFNTDVESHEEILEKNSNYVLKEGNTIFFSIHNIRLFKLSLEHNETCSDENITLANIIIEFFTNLAEYNYFGSGKHNNGYPSDQNAHDEFQDKMFKIAVERGIFQWLLGKSYSGKIDKLLKILDEWSVKTYEGKHVTLGLIIDPNMNIDNPFNVKVNPGTWLDFMKEDLVAVFTDCIHSVIELDKDCNFVQYFSISSGNKLPTCKLKDGVPIRFSHVVQNYVVDNKVGLFLLNNGDILLSKNQSICFVKRNNNWLNLSFESFCNSLSEFIEKYHIRSKKLIPAIFSSVLDVSFSHTGGIIAIVDHLWDKNKQEKLIKSEVLSTYDNLFDSEYTEEYDAFNKQGESWKKRNNAKKDSIKKKILKREVIKSLTQQKKFMEIDRKLRSELIALDGACILGTKGEVYSFGAIIQNDSGSAGGGRTAATKKLSAYGAAIKISTDGYIEIYVNQEKKYCIK